MKTDVRQQGAVWVVATGPSTAHRVLAWSLATLLLIPSLVLYGLVLWMPWKWEGRLQREAGGVRFEWTTYRAFGWIPADRGTVSGVRSLETRTPDEAILDGDDTVRYFVVDSEGRETRLRLPKVWTLDIETVRRFLNAFLKDPSRRDDLLLARQDKETLFMLPFFSLFAVLSGMFLWMIARRWELAVDRPGNRAILLRWTLGRKSSRAVPLDEIVKVESFEKTKSSRSGPYVQYHLRLWMRDGSAWIMPVESPDRKTLDEFVASVRERVSIKGYSGTG